MRHDGPIPFKYGGYVCGNSGSDPTEDNDRSVLFTVVLDVSEKSGFVFGEECHACTCVVATIFAHSRPLPLHLDRLTL